MKSSIVLTRDEIIEDLRSTLGLSGREAKEILEAFLERVTLNLVEGQGVSISGLGRWEKKLTPSRVARNPKTKEEVVLPERYRIAFSLSRTLRNKIKDLSGEET